MNKIELKRMIWDWNERTRQEWFDECGIHSEPDYREIEADSLEMIEHPIDSALYINEYKPCGGSRRAVIFFLDCGAVVQTEFSYAMDYAKQWGFDGIIPYEKLLDYITNIDTINPEDYHIGSCREHLEEK